MTMTTDPEPPSVAAASSDPAPDRCRSDAREPDGDLGEESLLSLVSGSILVSRLAELRTRLVQAVVRALPGDDTVVMEAAAMLLGLEVLLVGDSHTELRDAMAGAHRLASEVCLAWMALGEPAHSVSALLRIDRVDCEADGRLAFVPLAEAPLSSTRR